MNAAERRIRTYEAMGWHRTGWEADDRAAEWLITELASVGVDGHTQTFEFPSFAYEAAELRVGAEKVFGCPLYDGPFTGDMGVFAPLRSVPAGRTECITVWRPSADDPLRFGEGIYQHLEKLAADGAKAVVIVMGDKDNEPVLRNAERPRDPIGLPVLQVAPANMVKFDEGAVAKLVITGQRKAGTARNVVAEISGADPAAAPVTLMTPKSGWYTCAAERGGGIAIWIEVAGRIAAEPGRRSLSIVASSGHELHHLGLEHYISELGPDAANVHTWMHLGASIGSRNGQPAYAASDDELFNVATHTLSQLQLERRAFPVGSAGFGEARNIGEIGGRFVSFLGGHPYFHSPSDTYDRCIDPESLAKHTDAVERVIRYMLQ